MARALKAGGLLAAVSAFAMTARGEPGWVSAGSATTSEQRDSEAEIYDPLTCDREISALQNYLSSTKTRPAGQVSFIMAGAIASRRDAPEFPSEEGPGASPGSRPAKAGAARDG